MLESITIEHLVKKESEGQYYKLPFSVPSDVEKITVSYEYARLNGKTGRGNLPVNIIDLGLMDQNNRFLGWSGSNKKSVSVGEYDSTKGYLVTPVGEGQWSILIGAYKIAPDGVPVRYTVDFKPKGSCWLAGDLHMHSDASDGQHGIERLAEKAKAIGLDFIAISNHNNYSENLRLPMVPNLTLIPAVEWTHYRGHMNFFGVEAPFKNSFIANSDEDMLRIVNEAKEMGAVISVNHPKCNQCPYLWSSETVFDMVEVWNGPMRRVNLHGIAWWESLLKRGRRVPLVGGSDFHRDRSPVRMGNPVTVVYAASRSAVDILAAARDGHSYVSRSVRGAKLDVQCDGKTFGDEVAAGTAAQFTATGLRAGESLELVTDVGTVQVCKPSGGQAHGVFDGNGAAFVYAKVTYPVLGQRMVSAISNPIYYT